MREAVEVVEAAAVRLGDLDLRLTLVSAIGWSGMPSSSVCGDTTLPIGGRRPARPCAYRGAPRRTRAPIARRTAARGRASARTLPMIEPAPPSVLGRREREPALEERRRVETAALVEQELDHQLGAEVSDVLDRRAAPARERRSAAPRRTEHRPSRARVARGRPSRLHEPASRSPQAPGRRAAASTSRSARSRRRREVARDRPAVARALAEQAERGPFRERRLGAGGRLMRS